MFQHNDLNYICSDNKIHIRFRDFDKEQVVGGFERKLAYLFGYLMNYSYLPSIIGKYDNETILKNFLKTIDVQRILSTISIYSGSSKFKGVKLTVNYKKSKCSPFGSVDANCFPLAKNNELLEIGDLKTFLSMLKIDLVEYLFNDSYFIILRENKEKPVNNKFINKQEKKLERIKDTSLNLVELW